jgi:hypothetical protein
MRASLGPILLIVVSGALVAGLGMVLGGGLVPLGVPGEWTWNRLPAGVVSSPLEWLVGLASLAAFVGFVAVGRRGLGRPGIRRRAEAAWVAGLVVAGVGVQLGVQSAAPAGYGLAKWAFALHFHGSSGYAEVARTQVSDPRRFWAEYPEWIKSQDSLHIGTHPPGLFLAWRSLLDLYHAHPESARAVEGLAPPSMVAAFRVIAATDRLDRADHAAMVTVGALTLLCCALTVVPLYALVRLAHGPTAAWAAASLWPLVPSALMFQPAADAAFPLLTTAAIALAATGRRGGALASGLVLAIGMQFTLAFLACGLVAALVLAADGRLTPLRRLERIGWTGLGFVGATLIVWGASRANPLAIWWWNARHHAEFYREYPRSYLAWNLANPVELAVGLGLPIACAAAAGLRRSGRWTWATLLVLALLQLSGRSLSEVARLWLPLMPPIVAAAGVGIDQLGGRSATLATTAALVGVQALILQAAIQVVYPV